MIVGVTPLTGVLKQVMEIITIENFKPLERYALQGCHLDEFELQMVRKLTLPYICYFGNLLYITLVLSPRLLHAPGFLLRQSLRDSESQKKWQNV